MAERKYYELHVAGLTRQLPLCESAVAYFKGE